MTSDIEKLMARFDGRMEHKTDTVSPKREPKRDELSELRAQNTTLKQQLGTLIGLAQATFPNKQGHVNPHAIHNMMKYIMEGKL